MLRKILFIMSALVFSSTAEPEVIRLWDGPAPLATGELPQDVPKLTIYRVEKEKGTGTGTVAGSAVQLLYRLRLPAAAGGHVLDVNDWMYLTPNGTLMNRSQFRKFGFKVAELVATMRPAPAPAPASASEPAE